MTSAIQLAYEHASRAVGRIQTVDVGVVSCREFQRFAYASGDVNPRYFGDDAVAPPLYLSAVMEWGAGPANEQLRADGTGGSETAGVPIDGLRLMGAGQDLELHHPVTDGTAVTAEVSIDDAKLKQGRSGELLIMTVLRRFRDHAGSELLTCRETFIVREESST
ncbi:MAG: FAS1-like dehydratase domain-containing protein [Actinophytocola sp.]|uniref:FAS1-like dehydratase domain-containing protein n=1 Tax=Actinophytocola sp. TaxID=1872138 RepID=UPI003D6B5ED6